MLQNLPAEIVNCYERARLAREKAERRAAGWRWRQATSGNMHWRGRSPSSTTAGKPARSFGCFASKVSGSTLMM
jgi:hypothetical protein